MMRYPSSPRLCCGYTLIELMITIGIVAILVSIAAPAFTGLIENNRISSSALQWMNALQLSRSEAIKRNYPTRICTSNDGVTCTDSDWRDGWLLWIDAEGDSRHEAADIEEVIRVFNPLPEGVELTNSRNMSWVGYRPDGTVVGSTGIANATWSVCYRNGSERYGRKVVVSRTGRPRRELGADCAD